MEKSAPIYRRQTDHISADMYLYVCPRGQSEGAQILFMMIVKASRYHLQKQFIMHCIPPSMYLQFYMVATTHVRGILEQADIIGRGNL